MEEGAKSENHLTSAAAFVEGGIQDACDDACSICLESFCESDPSTVTSCKHEFHLQCILEWCQRSSQCPMCWQDISLKDPSSQELLDAIEQERSVRNNPAGNTTIFHHPTLGDFELQHLPISASDAELEERIIQHLAAAAAMGRARHIARREGQRSRSSAQGRPQFLVFSTHPNAPSHAQASSFPREEDESATALDVGGLTSLVALGEESEQLITPPPSGPTAPGSASSSVVPVNPNGNSSSSRGSPARSSPGNQDREGPSELHSFSETLKSRINAMSLRCKESITKSTRGWKEKLFARNSSVGDLGSEVRREVNAGIATVSRLIERLEARENNASTSAGVTNNLEDRPPDRGSSHDAGTSANSSLSDSDVQASHAVPFPSV